MDVEQLVPIIRSIEMPGWKFSPIGYMGVEVRKVDPPEDTYHPGQRAELSHHVVIDPSDSRDLVIAKIFKGLEFLVVHELKEQFKVHRVRIYDPHKES